MPLKKYTKASGERKRYQIDYTNWLDIGELAVSVVPSVLNNTVATPLVVDGVQILPTGLGVQYYAAGGANGVTYEVLFTMTSDSSESQIKQDVNYFTIREP